MPLNPYEEYELVGCPDAKIWGYCAGCEDEIYDGDTIYNFNGEYYCENCIDEMKETAGGEY